VKGELENGIRENIINYSDEGGSEGDQTGYDLSVLLKPAYGPYISSPTDKIPMDTMHHHSRSKYYMHLRMLHVVVRSTFLM